MEDFLRFYKKKCRDYPMHLEMRYNKTEDWFIALYRKGMARYYQDAEHLGDDVLIFMDNDIDLELLCAKAHAALKEWLREFEGGY